MEKDEVQRLKTLMRSEIERKVGYPLRSSTDLNKLAELILAETREYISATTLKRFWDLYEGHHTPRPSIWNALSKFVGDANFAAFCKRMQEDKNDISGEVAGRRIDCEELPPGLTFEISWSPNRVLTVRHINADNFEVIRSLNSKVVEGATFRALYIIEGLPMLLEDYRATPLSEPIIYEVGRKGGVLVNLEA